MWCLYLSRLGACKKGILRHHLHLLLLLWQYRICHCVCKGLFIIYWEYGTGVSGYGTRTFSDASEYRTQRLLCFYGTGHELFFGKKSLKLYTIFQNKRMRRCGVPPPPPPPIIFERLKLPQQIIHRRKENISESPNCQKYWKNILVSRFYEQFSRNRRNLGHFRKFEKISNS